MRKLSVLAVAMIVAISLYFTFAWGYDGLRMLTSPTYGLDDVWRSQFIFVIGSLFGLGPMGLVKLAAFFGALKLAVAGICLIHILDRCRSLAGGTANSEILEGALIIVVMFSIISVGPSIQSQNVELVRAETIQLMLAAVATALCLLERKYGRADEDTKPVVSMELTATAGRAPWYAPFR
ncbi:MAG: hypothetical protein ACREB2_05565 [Pseudolabrys sp.]